MEPEGSLIDSGDTAVPGFRRPDVTRACILFSITILLFIMIAYRVQKSNFYTGILVTEFLIIMLPALIFLVLFRYDLKKVLRLNKTGAVNFLLIFCIMIFALPLASIINLANLLIVNSIFGKIIVSQPPVAQNLPGLLVNILLVGGTAGLCEEFLFRGVLQRSFEVFGKARAILLAAFLFSLTHLDFQKIFGTFTLGVLIGFLVYRTNSLYSGMFAHFTNNSVAVVVSYAATKLMNVLGNRAALPAQPDLDGMMAVFQNLPKEQLVIAAFFYGIIFLFLFSVFAVLIFAFLKLNPAKKGESRPTPAARDKTGLLYLLPGVALIAMMYFAEVMKFRGVASPFVEQLKRLLGV